MNKKIRHAISVIVSILMVILTFIAANHAKNYKNVKEAEYMQKMDNTIITALSEINNYERKEHILDSFKYEYWTRFRTVKDRHLRFYPISDNGKWKIARQIVSYNYPNFCIMASEDTLFYFDDYIPTFVAGRNILEEIIDNINIYTFIDTIESHLSIPPVYTDYELDTIHSIIEKHLRMHDICTDFEYCIYIPTFNKFILNKELDIIEIISKGRLYKSEVYNENAGLFAFFLVQFLDETDYLTARDYFVIFFTWGIVFLVYLLFVYLLFTGKRISEISELRNDFINNVTHEFKTPIATILLATEGLKDKDIKINSELSLRYIQIIEEENERLSHMVGTILDVASISKKSFLLRQNNNNVDIHYAIDVAIKELVMLLHQKNGSINVSYNATCSIGNVDGGQIITVIKNIIENAIKYTLGKPPLIEIETKNKGKYLVISIKDYGIGISKKQQKKIFEKLYRSPKGDIHDVKGYGLGLYSVKAIIRSYRGKIKVESTINEGSTFIIYLPIII